MTTRTPGIVSNQKPHRIVKSQPAPSPKHQEPQPLSAGVIFPHPFRFPPHSRQSGADLNWFEENHTLMKNQILCALAVIALATGCAESRKHMGAGNENDQNVLTGGPVTGTTIKDLPKAVKQTLKERFSNAEVADIDKQTKNGRIVYKISFMEPGKNPTIYVAEDGSVTEGDTKSNSTTTSDT